MTTRVITSKHLCASCQTERARFRTLGNPRWRARPDHDLCSRCHRRYKAHMHRWYLENTLDGWIS